MFKYANYSLLYCIRINLNTMFTGVNALYFYPKCTGNILFYLYILFLPEIGQFLAEFQIAEMLMV